MVMKEKIHKFDGREFIVRSEEKSCVLEVSDGTQTLTVRPSTELYGRGFRVYQGGSWKGNWDSPEQAVDAACQELITLSKAQTEEQLCKQLQTFYEELPSR